MKGIRMCRLKFVYRGFTIDYNPKPIPTAKYDWDGIPEDEEPCVNGYSARDVILQIDERLE